MGSQPSIPENNESREAPPVKIETTTSNIKSILKGKSNPNTELSAAVSGDNIAQDPTRRISRRASIAPPELDEEAINSLLDDNVVAEDFVAANSHTKPSDAVIQNLTASDLNLEDTSSNDIVGNGPFDDFNYSGGNETLANNSLLIDSKNNEAAANTTKKEYNSANEAISKDSTDGSNTGAMDISLNDSSASSTLDASATRDALLWAPILTSSGNASNISSLNMQQQSKGKEDKYLISKIKRRATLIFRKDEEEISLDGIIKNLLSHRGAKVQRRAIDIPKSHIEWVCRTCLEVVMSQSSLLEINGPVNVCGKYYKYVINQTGDVHGQYDDLIRIFEMCGYPPNSNYLFLGDYVDRGKQSLETILLLMCFKIKYPENFFILRGNHECASVNKGNILQ